MKVNFDKLSIGTLRKYQYAYKLNMGPDDAPLKTREALLKAVENHFQNVLEVNETNVIGKFLKLKKEERLEQPGVYGLRKQNRPQARGGPTNRNKPKTMGLPQ